MATEAATLEAEFRLRVLCVDLTEVADPGAGHAHVSALETIASDGATRRWTLVQAITAMRQGVVFEAASPSGGEASVLEPAVCPQCQHATLQTEPSHELALCQ